MPYEARGKCVYKKDGGAKVGCTKGDVNKYLAALHANANESISEAENILDYKKLTYEISNEGMHDAAYFPSIGKGVALRFRKKTYEHINDGEPVMEMHIDIPEEYQGKGFAVLMLKSFIYREGVCAYFSHGRIINNLVYKVIDKISLDKNFAVTEEEGYGFVICEDYTPKATNETTKSLIKRLLHEKLKF